MPDEFAHARRAYAARLRDGRGSNMTLEMPDERWSTTYVEPGTLREPESFPDEPDDRTNDEKPAGHRENTVQVADRTTPGQPPALALEPNILDRFVADLRLSGVAGEERLAQLTYLALTSRVLPWGKATERPVSVIAKGTSSSGKSHTTQTVLRFFPASSYLDLGSMSKRYLLYTEETFKSPLHRRSRGLRDRRRRRDPDRSAHAVVGGAPRPRHRRRETGRTED